MNWKAGSTFVIVIGMLVVPTIVDTVRRDTLTERGWVVSFPRKVDDE